MEERPAYRLSRWYDGARDDYVMVWTDAKGNDVLEIRCEDPDEPETRNGRGVRVCTPDIEVPLDEFLRAPRDPFLPCNGPGRKAPE